MGGIHRRAAFAALLSFLFLFGLGSAGALGSSVARPCTTVTSTVISTVTSWLTTTVTSTVTTTEPTVTTTSTTTTTPSSSGAFFSENFDAGITSISSLWQHEPAFDPALYLTEPGNPGQAAGLKTTANSYTPNTGQLTSLWLTAADAYSGWDASLGRAVDGVDRWYHQQFKLPAGAYQPTPTEWNWMVEWHDDNHSSSYGACCSMAIGIFGDAYLHNGLIWRLSGGNSASPTYDYSCALPPDSLIYDHWYDSVEHVYWSTSPTVGKVEWWLDGVQICSKSFPTLFSNPDGTFSYNTFGIYNYHAYSSVDSRIDYDNVSIGPTRASVGG